MSRVDLFPSIDLRNGGVVRLLHGDDAKQTHYDTDPVAGIARYAAAGARYVHIVDLDAAFGEAAQVRVIESVVAELSRLPEPRPVLQLGGGLRDAESVAWALGAGCQRVVIGSMIARDPDLFGQLAQDHPDRVVAALDVKDDRLAVAGWTEKAEEPLDAICARLSELPLAAVLVTDVSRDGAMSGPNVELTSTLAQRASSRGLVSGGVRSLEDLEVIRAAPDIAGAVVGRALWDGAMGLEEALSVFASEPKEPDS